MLSKSNTGFEHDSPKDFVVSQWQTKDRSALYLCYRWMIASFYLLSVLITFGIAYSRGEIKVYFIYLTNLNLAAQMITTIFGAVLVTQYYRNKYQVPERMTTSLKVYWFLSISTSMYAILISFIYWAILFHQENSVLDTNNVIAHMTNSLVLIVDIFIVKHCARFAHLVWPSLCGFAYLFLTWLYPFLGGLNRRGQNFIYPILNWNEKPGLAVLAAFMVLFTGAIIHSILVCVQKLRSKLHEKFYKETLACNSTNNDLSELEAQKLNEVS